MATLQHKPPQLFQNAIIKGHQSDQKSNYYAGGNTPYQGPRHLHSRTETPSNPQSKVTLDSSPLNDGLICVLNQQNTSLEEDLQKRRKSNRYATLESTPNLADCITQQRYQTISPSNSRGGFRLQAAPQQLSQIQLNQPRAAIPQPLQLTPSKTKSSNSTFFGVPCVTQKSIGGGVYYSVKKHQRKIKLGMPLRESMQTIQQSQEFKKQKTIRQSSQESENTQQNRMYFSNAASPLEQDSVFATIQDVRNEQASREVQFTIHQLENMAQLLRQFEKTMALKKQTVDKVDANGMIVCGANRENKTWLPFMQGEMLQSQQSLKKSQGGQREPVFPNLNRTYSLDKISNSSGEKVSYTQYRQSNKVENNKARNFTLPKVPSLESNTGDANSTFPHEKLNHHESSTKQSNLIEHAISVKDLGNPDNLNSNVQLPSYTTKHLKQQNAQKSIRYSKKSRNPNFQTDYSQEQSTLMQRTVSQGKQRQSLSPNEIQYKAIPIVPLNIENVKKVSLNNDRQENAKIKQDVQKQRTSLPAVFNRGKEFINEPPRSHRHEKEQVLSASPIISEQQILADTYTPQPIREQLNEEQLFRMTRRNFELYRHGVLNQSNNRRFTGNVKTPAKKQLNASVDAERTEGNKHFSRIMQRMLEKQKPDDGDQSQQRPTDGFGQSFCQPDLNTSTTMQPQDNQSKPSLSKYSQIKLAGMKGQSLLSSQPSKGAFVTPPLSHLASTAFLQEKSQTLLLQPLKQQLTSIQSKKQFEEVRDDLRQDDVYNFIKKANAQKAEISRGSEFSKTIAEAYAQNKYKNSLCEVTSDNAAELKSSSIRLNESTDRMDRPLYYNFGLMKPVSYYSNTCTSPLQAQLTTPPIANKYSNSTAMQAPNSSKYFESMPGPQAINIKLERQQYKPPLKKKPTQLMSTTASSTLKTISSGEGMRPGQLEDRQPDELVGHALIASKIIREVNKRSRLLSNTKQIPTLVPKNIELDFKKQATVIVKEKKVEVKVEVKPEIIKEVVEERPKSLVEKPMSRSAQKKEVRTEVKLASRLTNNQSPLKSMSIPSVAQTPARQMLQKIPSPRSKEPIQQAQIMKKATDSQALLPLPPAERVRPALFVMLEKQLAEAKEAKKIVEIKAKEPPKITFIQIYHREDIDIRQLLHETRVSKALDLSNCLLRLANKSSLPPQALYNIPYTQFFTPHDVKCLRKAGIQIPKNKDLSVFVRSREYYAIARENAFIILTQELQVANNIPGTKVLPEIGSGGGVSGSYAKFFVGYGNNFPLVRSILKNRWWMTLSDTSSFEESNIVWTSWKKQKITNRLMTYQQYLRTYGAFDENKVHIRKIYSRMEDNFHLANKKGLLLNLKEYYRLKGKCVFETKIFPQTFLLESTDVYNQEEYDSLKRYIMKHPDTVWIVKPGENSNRGAGITLCENSSELEQFIRQITPSNKKQLIEHNCQVDSTRTMKKHQIQANSRTIIIQSYIKNPLLIHKRKFDIRVYGMLVTHYGTMRGYFYEDGYLRTSSKEFSLDNFSNKYIHLTNDAIQKNSEDYGKFESGNKLSYAEFQRYLDSPEFLSTSKYLVPGGIKFVRDLLPQIRHLVTESFRSVAYKKIDPYRRVNSFEIFGFDFMIDEDFCVQLIEANTNPCVEINGCNVLARIIPNMLECAFRIAVDPLLPPPDWNFKKGLEPIPENKFSLVYDETIEGESLKQLYDKDKSSTLRWNNNLSALQEEEKFLEQSQQDEDYEDDEEEENDDDDPQ